MPSPDDDFASNETPLDDLTGATSGLLRRVGFDPEELTGMIDALSGLLAMPGGGPRLALAEPVYDVSTADDGRWLVIRIEQGEERVLANVSAKATAEKVARRHAKSEGGTLVVHRTNGLVQSTYHYPDPIAQHASSADDEEHDTEGGSLVRLDAFR